MNNEQSNANKEQSTSFAQRPKPLFAACIEDEIAKPPTNNEVIFPSFNFTLPTFTETTQPVFAKPSEETAAKPTDGSKNWSWLSNQSFSTQAQDSFTQFYQPQVQDETLELEAAEVSDTEIYEEHIERKKSKPKKRSRKRSPSPATVEELKRELLAKSSNKIFIEDVGLNPAVAFRMDRKADRANLGSGTMYHAFVARYYPKWKFYMLGGHRSKKPKTVPLRYYSRKNAKLLKDENDVLDYANYHLVYDKGKFQRRILSSGSYVPLEISLNELKASSYYDDGKATLFSSRSLEGEEEKVPAVPKRATYAEQIKQKTIAFNQYLHEFPNDVDHWLKFLKFQDEVFLHPEGLVAEFGKVTEKSMMEKKLSIIDRALEKNSNSIKLFLAKLELCKDYWDTSQLKKEWKRFTFNHPNDIDVWETYLTFLQTKFSVFSISAVVAGYAKCFSTLINILDGNFQTHDCPVDLQERMLGLFGKYCQFLRQSGYSERALATYQGIIEFNFFAPDSFSSQMERKDQLAFFEPFWDSGMPRFGETDAIGWDQVMKMKHFQDQGDKLKALDEDEDSVMQMKLSKHETWLKLEKLRQRHHWLPWRAGMDDKDECEDPDRMVLFDDVSPFLFQLTDDKHRFRLLQNFLNYLDITNDPHYATTCQHSCCHASQFVDRVAFPWVRRDYFKYKFGKNSSSLPNLLIIDGDELEGYEKFVNGVSKKCIELFSEPFRTELKVLRMQHQRIQLMKQQTLSKQSVKEVKKSMKDLLKEAENRNNLQMWYEYIRLEMDFGTDAKKLLEALLQCHSQSPVDIGDAATGPVMCKFYKSLVECENEPCDKLSEQRCVSLLASVGAGETFNAEITPSTILKARRRYQKTTEKLVDDCVYESDNSNDGMNQFMSTVDSPLVEWVNCYAWFQYLTMGLHPSCIVYETILEKLQNRAKASINGDKRLMMQLEKLFMGYIGLLLHHINNKPASLKVMRTVLNRALASFPDSPMFLHLLVNLESRSHIAGRLRRYFNHRMLLTPSALSCLYSLLTEMHRRENLLSSLEEFVSTSLSENLVAPITDDGVVNRIASIFESASKSSVCNSCPLLWRLYIAFEVKRGNLNKAKLIFYQAVQRCPWVKNLYVDAIQAFPDDLQEILDIMTEKGIRVRIPVEEVELLMGLEPTSTESVEIIKTEPDEIEIDDSGPTPEIVKIE